MSPPSRLYELSAAPSCEGTQLRYCNRTNGRVVRVDCAEAFSGQGNTVCGRPFSCDARRPQGCDAVPLGCIGAASGELCDPVRGIYCGEGMSCVSQNNARGETETACEGLASTCTNAQITEGCEGDIATFCVSNENFTASEPIGIDCASYGSACGATPTGQALCFGDEGAPCEDPVVHPDTPFVCRFGLLCEGGRSGFGLCIPGGADAGVGDRGAPPDAPAPSDAGVADQGVTGLDAGAPGPAPEGCGCTSHRARRAPFGLLGWLLLGVLHGLRRRRMAAVGAVTRR